MPYAAYDRLGTDPIEGGIEITWDEYVHAVDMIMAGYRVIIVDGKLDFELVVWSEEALDGS